MDKFEDPPQPLYSLLMDLNPCMFPCHIFFDDKRLYTSGKTFEIITMPSRSVLSASKQIHPSTDLETCNYTFRIPGQLCHLIGSLLPSPGTQPAFSQIYIYNSDPMQQAQ